MEGLLIADSPIVDGLRMAAALERRFPASFAPHIRQALWEAIGDYYGASGGRRLPDGVLPILAPLSPILAVCPLREMGLSC
jgi:hypothetical protein